MWWMLREGREGRRYRHWKRWRCRSGIWTTWATFLDPRKTSFRWSILLASRSAVFLFKVFWGKLYYYDLCKSSALYSLWRVYTSPIDIQVGHGTCGSTACRKTYFCFSLDPADIRLCHVTPFYQQNVSKRKTGHSPVAAFKDTEECAQPFSFPSAMRSIQPSEWLLLRSGSWSEHGMDQIWILLGVYVSDKWETNIVVLSHLILEFGYCGLD